VGAVKVPNIQIQKAGAEILGIFMGDRPLLIWSVRRIKGKPEAPPP
jgi:hypothetical protein